MVRDCNAGNHTHKLGCKLLDILGIPQGIDVLSMDLSINFDTGEAPRLTLRTAVCSPEFSDQVEQIFELLQAKSGELQVNPVGEIIRTQLVSEQVEQQSADAMIEATNQIIKERDEQRHSEVRQHEAAPALQ